MTTVAYDPCNEEPGVFTASGNCLEEGSRIIGGMLVKVGFDIKTIIDQTTFDAAVTDEDIIPLKKLAGNWTQGTPKTRPGTGNKETEFSSLSYSIPFRHYSVDANLKMWNKINQASGAYSMAFVFEDFAVWTALNRSLDLIGMTISAFPQSGDELGGSREFAGTAQWVYPDLPYKLDEMPNDLVSANFNV